MSETVNSSMARRILGIILARGGSKGIPGKNIKPLLGKPLIVYTIEAARASGIFDRLILSTDDEAIANVARHYGCEAPFLRPKELAQDHTPGTLALRHAVEWLRTREGYVPHCVFALQPTSPLRQPFHIREAVRLFEETSADSVLSVMEIPGHYHPLWALKIDEGNKARLFVTGESVRARIPRRQELPKAYVNSGAIYLFKTELLSRPAGPDVYGEHVAAYRMDDRYNVMIDTMEDWATAEKKLAVILREREAEAEARDESATSA